ncbi:unnamed protein product [Effrenium voratum]|uniref:Uncharacterized protein n=1 Tax=Effrenium voratum TaxID=2562239 RepID=A0AA36HXQ7_9DINO|nr:unnamed protein product [Effrenium voratum]
MEAAPVLEVRYRDLGIPNATAVLLENYFTVEECERYFQVLTTEIDWKNQLVNVKKQLSLRCPRGAEDGERSTVDEPRRTIFMLTGPPVSARHLLRVLRA